MKKTVFALLIAVFLFSFCSLNNSDDEEINLLINEFSDLLLDGYSSGEETDATKTEINTIGWYREGVDQVTFNADITIENDTAIAEITVSFPGILHLVYIDDSLDTVTVDKDFTDTLIRYARFVKDTVKDYHNGWRLDMVTSGEISSNTEGLAIDSVRFFVENKIDTVISDIHSYFKRCSTMVFDAGEAIEITVYTPNTDNSLFVHSYWKRARFDVVDGVYKGIWNAASEPGLYRCVLDELEESVLNDDEYPYDNAAWFIPYIVE